MVTCGETVGRMANTVRGSVVNTETVSRHAEKRFGGCDRTHFRLVKLRTQDTPPLAIWMIRVRDPYRLDTSHLRACGSHFRRHLVRPR